MSDCASNRPCGIMSEMLEGVASLKESVTSLSRPTNKSFAPRSYPHTPEQIAQELRIDEEGKMYWRRKGNGPRKLDRPVGTIKTSGNLEYKVTRIDGHLYKNSALAFCLCHGRWPLPGMVIDHISHDTLDDSCANLREVTNAENVRNRRGLQRNNISGVNGVSWDSAAGKWYAQLKYKGKAIPGGRYDSLDEAIKARQALEIKYGVASSAYLNKAPAQAEPIESALNNPNLKL